MFRINIEDKYPEIICSLTQEIMENPVITNNGISFEKKCIEKWLLKKKRCPITNEYLDKNLLIKNYNLKNIIDKLKNENKCENERGLDFRKEELEYLVRIFESEKELNKRVIINKERYIKIIKNDLNYINNLNNKQYFTGIGEYYLNNELIYIGEIRNNIIYGHGKYYKKNILKLEGYFRVNDDILENNNNIIECYDNKNGIIRNIILDGYGIEYYKNGNIKYKGDFKNSIKSGVGIFYNKNKKIEYDGQFLNNKRHGHGILYIYENILIEKKKIKSTFKDGYLWNYNKLSNIII